MKKQPLIYRILTRLFGEPEVLTSGAGVAYLIRWRILYSPKRGLYIHHFVADDGARHCHDHPRTFYSIGLWGGYREEVRHQFGPDTIAKSHAVYTAPWIRKFGPEHTHRLTLLPGRTCWTIVYVGPVVRPWGFWVGFKWIPWRDYVARSTYGKQFNGREAGLPETGENDE